MTQQLYNALMEEIEPELTTYCMPMLDSWYEGETEESRRERTERYAKAFEVLDERFSHLFGLWKERLLEFKKQATAQAKEKAKTEDDAALRDIDRSIESV